MPEISEQERKTMGKSFEAIYKLIRKQVDDEIFWQDVIFNPDTKYLSNSEVMHNLFQGNYEPQYYYYAMYELLIVASELIDAQYAELDEYHGWQKEIEDEKAGNGVSPG